MKFTLSWLKMHLDTTALLQAIAEKLTMIGLEVEKIEDRAKMLAPFTVARVLSAEKHPNVLKNCGLNPDEYQGFAWGMGIDRIAMLKYGMPDLRAFFEADVRWLSHYGFRPLDLPTLAGGLSG